jgi:hypothetical protein
LKALILNGYRFHEFCEKKIHGVNVSINDAHLCFSNLRNNCRLQGLIEDNCLQALSRHNDLPELLVACSQQVASPVAYRTLFLYTNHAKAMAYQVA